MFLTYIKNEKGMGREQGGPVLENGRGTEQIKYPTSLP